MFWIPYDFMFIKYNLSLSSSRTSCWWKTFFPNSNHCDLTLSSIYTHFNTLGKKALGKHCEKRWNCSKWAISPFSTIFSVQSVSENPSTAIFQLSSAASLNLGRPKNGILGNGLNCWIVKYYTDICQSLTWHQMFFFLSEINNRTHMCRLILLYTLRRINTWSRAEVQRIAPYYRHCK